MTTTLISPEATFVHKLEPGVFVFMPANAPHALEATSNLAFILTLSSAS